MLKRENEILKELIRRELTINDRNCFIKNSTSHCYFGGVKVRLLQVFLAQLLEILTQVDLTPLMLACVIGDESAVEFLLANGARISHDTPVIYSVIGVSHNF